MVGSPCSPRDSQESSPTPQFKSIISLALSLFYGLLSHLYVTTGKTVILTIQTFVSKVMSLLLNMLYSFVIVFLPRNKCLLFSWLQSPSPRKYFHFSPSIFHEVIGLDDKDTGRTLRNTPP